MQINYINKFILLFIKFSIPPTKRYIVFNSTNIYDLPHHKNTYYDYIVLNQVLETSPDIYQLLDLIGTKLTSNGRIIIIFRNFMHPFLKNLVQALLSKNKQGQNWLSCFDIKTFLTLSNYQLITHQPLCFMSVNIPILSNIFNYLLLYFFPFNHLAFLHYFSARKIRPFTDVSTSIIIPVKNEAGNIELLFSKLPVLGSQSEVIFIVAPSRDETRQKILQCISKYTKLLPFKFKVFDQTEKLGKAEAVRIGFDNANGELLIIYDADMSVNPTDLYKFYFTAISGKGELINGSRLVYPMETNAMQLLNILGNKFYSLLYSWILGQAVKDTLCGTKVIWKKDYMLLKNKYPFFGKYDPFGDFDLLTGASLLNLKIIDLPVRYLERTYGSTNIRRFRNAWELTKYSILAIKLAKFRLK